MKRGAFSRIIPVILIVVIAIVAISALVALGRAIFSGDHGPSPVADTSEQSLLNTSADRSVQMTVRGPIVANENFQSHTIMVSPSQRSLTNYQGYLGTVTSNQTFGNNVPAYTQFVHALDKANLTKGTAFTGEKGDTQGICATGSMIEFTIYTGNTAVKHLWTSTCKGSPGSLDASVTQLENLFTVQIPGAKSSTSNQLPF